MRAYSWQGQGGQQYRCRRNERGGRQERGLRVGGEPDHAEHRRCRQQKQSLDQVIPAVGAAERGRGHEVADQRTLCALGRCHVKPQQHRDEPQRSIRIDQRQRSEEQRVHGPASDQERQPADAIRPGRQWDREQRRRCCHGRPQQRNLCCWHAELVRPQKHECIRRLPGREDRKHEQHPSIRWRQRRPAPRGRPHGWPLERGRLADRQRQCDTQRARDSRPQQDVAHRHLQRQQSCREQWSDHGAGVVEGAMQAEGEPAPIGWHRLREQRVARG